MLLQNLFAVLSNILILQSILVAAVNLDQETVNQVAASLDVRYDVIDNLQDSFKTYRAQITLSNKGSHAIDKGNWALYLCHIRMIEPANTSHNPGGYVLRGGYGIKVTHINGCLFKFQPTDDFKKLLPGNMLKIQFNASDWCVSRTDVMPKWYITADHVEARTITSTAGEDLAFVGAFRTSRQWKRYPDDRYNPYSPQRRYDVNSGIRDLKMAPLRLVPTPLYISAPPTKPSSKKAFFGTGDWIVIAHKTLSTEAKFLAGKLGIHDVTTKGSARTFRVIQLLLSAGDQGIYIQGVPSKHAEAYSLEVDTEREIITIRGNEPVGVFYGVQSLMSVTENGWVPHITIQDAPRFTYRGMHLDLGRNFFPKEVVFKLITVMAMYKLNKLHLHLTDDEGWRLEIPGLQELTQIGSRRCHDPTERTCILSQLGSGPGTGNTGSGYFTVQDYRQILRFAHDHHIEVIPEFDMPGHAHAAVKSMEGRYKNFSANGLFGEGSKFLLTDPDDRSKYLSVQYFRDNAINPCINSSYDFIEHLLVEVMRIHQGVQPLTRFHFGGDEVANGAWTNSPACEQLAQRLKLNYSGPHIAKQLKEYFVRRVTNITAAHGVQVGAWEDGLLSANENPFNRSQLRNDHVIAYAWGNVWEWGTATHAYNFANAGYQVVMTQATHLFFDHPYEPDPEERGYYWAPRFTDTEKTFGFMPLSLYANADYKRSGEPITDLCKDLYNGNCQPLERVENIIGMAGAVWTETVRTPEQLDSMVFPRLLALAERAWHKASWEDEQEKNKRELETKRDWKRFVNTLGYKELPRLDQLNIAYHLPPPGARVEDGKLKTDVAIPGLKIELSLDGGLSWEDAKDGAFVRGMVTLATRSADRRRLSRLVVLDNSITSASSGGLTATRKRTIIVFHCFIAVLLLKL